MLGLQCGKLQNTLSDFAAAKQKQRSCFHLFFFECAFFPPIRVAKEKKARKKGGKKRKKMEQNEQSVPWSFKRMCTKKCEQENMAKGREKNFFLLNFFSKKKKRKKVKASHFFLFIPRVEINFLSFLNQKIIFKKSSKMKFNLLSILLLKKTLQKHHFFKI